MNACSELFTSLLATLDGSLTCRGADPVLYLNDPTSLTDGTMPVIEVVMIGGALLALGHAVQQLRRRQDAAPLGVWLAALVYVLVLEPPLYFPEAFGLTDATGLVFIHNEFTVGFLYGRMPLYIALLYPAMVYLAWTIVRSWRLSTAGGLLRRSFVAAVCVGVVHQFFYEVFDMLGPHHSWWLWNPDVATNDPMLGPVPVSSMVNFALVMPTAFAFLVGVVIERKARSRARDVLLPAVAVGALTPLVSAPGQVPLSLLSAEPVPQAVAVGLALVMSLAALVVAARCFASARPEPPADRYLLVHGGGYLVVLLVLWALTVPDLDGGADLASLGYALLCLVVSGVVLARTLDSGHGSPTTDARDGRHPGDRSGHRAPAGR